VTVLQNDCYWPESCAFLPRRQVPFRINSSLLQLLPAAAVPAQSSAMAGLSSAAAAAAGSAMGASQQGYASAAEKQEVEELMQQLDSAGLDRRRVSPVDQ
jgi:hypothetical protein